MVKKLLQIEGVFFLLTAFVFYHLLHGDWLIFILLLFIPDISMIGYLKYKKIGAIIYNSVHNYVLALFVIGLGYLILKHEAITQFGIILFAHVSMDRVLGFGLKYPTNFKDTHFQKV